MSTTRGDPPEVILLELFLREAILFFRLSFGTNSLLGNGAPINYLSRANPTKLKLIQGDGEVFSDVLTLISDYEGVLSRRESLAANLGAKLTGPRLVKAMEGCFEGSITISLRDAYMSNPHPVAWLDIVQFAKTNPNDFTLSNTQDRGRCRQFSLKGVQVEITEDDWRFIMSGALDRFLPPHPIEEDESAELATLEILEQRVQVLIKKADEVARKARQLNYHLSGRRAAISSRRTQAQSATGQSPGFQAVNHPQVPNSRAAQGYDMKADLLQQYVTASSQSQSGSARTRTQTSISMPTTPVVQQGPSISGAAVRQASAQQGLLNSSRPSPAAVAESTTSADDPLAAQRPLITARIEKLARGDTVYPPCDRCRRLRVQCVKHLTACNGCTKKHAKCVWKSVTDDEMAWLKNEMGASVTGEGENEGDDGASNAGRYTPGPPTASAAGFSEHVFAPSRGGSLTASRRQGSLGPPAAMEVHTGGNSMGDFGLRDQLPSSRDSSFRDHDRLSQMASVASAAAEAREVRNGPHVNSRGSSAGD